MKFSEQWLRQWVNPALNTNELAEQMAMLGLTVDAMTPVAGKFSNVVVGEIVSRIQHPNADKLSCCEVNVGEKELLKIVCGAPNARAGIKVAVAKVGAVLPGDFHIKEAKLRGELSQGMLCSAKELQLVLGKSEAEGIIELPMDAKVGEDFNTYFKASDCIIDVDITPNRGDALSIRGLARDIAAALQLEYKNPAASTCATSSNEVFPIKIEAPQACPRYVGRIIRNINNTAQTPSYMQHALQRANIRLINPIVDITNFVMLELGQPMHAFDLSKIKNKITVRHAKGSATSTNPNGANGSARHQESDTSKNSNVMNGSARDSERVKLLDEQEITLTEHDLIIADDEKPLALAGIMGGIESGVSPSTTDIFLEAAFFAPKNICLSKRRHNTSSDSSHRFERGVDFNLPPEAIERATQLILEITGGQPAEIVDVISKNDLPSRNPVFLARDQIKRMLGITISDDNVVRILTSLGMTVKPVQNGWDVTPPSFRFDMSLPIDLIEELARMTGYQTIPATDMVAPLTMKSFSEGALCEKRMRTFLVGRGYHEAITYSFISPELFSLFSPNIKPITLKNPLSQDMSVMRATLWPGLLQAVQMNLRHQCERMKFFETGLCFEGELQTPKLAMVITGGVHEEQWGEKMRSADFYDLKADVEALFHTHTHTHTHPALHPGRSAALYKNNKQIGWIGEIHPQVLSHLDIKQPVMVCELDLAAVKSGEVPRYETFSRFPSVRRDLALVVKEHVEAADLCRIARQKGGELLQDALIFDVYQGKGVEPGKKSVAMGLTFVHASRTLRDEEINEVIQGVITELERELEATLRT